MKASSESGLCAATISWGATEVIGGIHFSVHHGARKTRLREENLEMEKGGSPSRSVNWKGSVGGHLHCASRAVPQTAWHLQSNRSALPLLPVHSPEVKPPSSWPGSIRHLLPAWGGPAAEPSDSTFSLTPDQSLCQWFWRGCFASPRPLIGVS